MKKGAKIYLKTDNNGCFEYSVESLNEKYSFTSKVFSLI